MGGGGPLVCCLPDMPGLLNQPHRTNLKTCVQKYGRACPRPTTHTTAAAAAACCWSAHRREVTSFKLTSAMAGKMASGPAATNSSSGSDVVTPTTRMPAQPPRTTVGKGMEVAGKM